jgi:flagellar protein FliO/FliZ
MLTYILKLAILLPMIGVMAWGSLWLWKRYQPGMLGAARSAQDLAVIASLNMGPGARIAVVRFGASDVLIGVSRASIVRLGEHPATTQEVDHG